MDRAYEANPSSSPPTPPNPALLGYPAEGNTPTEPGAWWFHMVTEEIRTAIVAAGLTPSATTVNQLATAIKDIAIAAITDGNWSVSGGVGFNYDLTVTNGSGGTPATGTIYFGNANKCHQTFDGTNMTFTLPGDLWVNGYEVATQLWITQNYLNAATIEATYASESWVNQYFAPLASFANGFGGNVNYAKFPNGLIIQFGYATGGTSSNVGVCPITFPVTFPNACLSAVCNGLRSTTGATPSNYVYNVSSSGCDFLMDYSAQLGAQGGYWMAIGH